MLVPVTVLARPPPGTTHLQAWTILELRWSACSGTHETRQLCVFRREGICVDRSAINLDTSTGSRSPVKTFGRCSIRGPSRLARKMAVRETRLTCTPTRVKTYPKGSGTFSATTRARFPTRLLESSPIYKTIILRPLKAAEGPQRLPLATNPTAPCHCSHKKQKSHHRFG